MKSSLSPGRPHEPSGAGRCRSARGTYASEIQSTAARGLQFILIYLPSVGKGVARV